MLSWHHYLIWIYLLVLWQFSRFRITQFVVEQLVLKTKKSCGKGKTSLSPIKAVSVSGRSSGFQLFIAIPQDSRIYASRDKRIWFLLRLSEHYKSYLLLDLSKLVFWAFDLQYLLLINKYTYEYKIMKIYFHFRAYTIFHLYTYIIWILTSSFH